MPLPPPTAPPTEVNHPVGVHPLPVCHHVPPRGILPDTQHLRGAPPGIGPRPRVTELRQEAGSRLRSTALRPGVQAPAAAPIPGVPGLLQKAFQNQPGTLV